MFTVRSDNKIVEVAWPFNCSPLLVATGSGIFEWSDWDSNGESNGIIDASGICGPGDSAGITAASSVKENGSIGFQLVFSDFSAPSATSIHL